MKMETFFRKHPVFRVDELDRFLSQLGKVAPRARESLLAYHKKRGRIRLIKRGMYAVVPIDADPDQYPVDHFLLASKLTDDSILAYHTALEAHGYAHTLLQVQTCLSTQSSPPFIFQNMTFLRVRQPAALIKMEKTDFDVGFIDRAGLKCPVTGLERTFADVLDRPNLAGGWEEVWRSLEAIEYLNLDRIAEYVMILGNSTVSAKVGYFLEQHRESLMADEKFLETLRVNRPKQPHYMNRLHRKGGRFQSRWNLVVPEEIVNRTWEELS